MYFSVSIFYIFTPLALGSVWAMIPALLIVPVLIFRIIDEEKELKDNLQGDIMNICKRSNIASFQVFGDEAGKSLSILET